MKGGNYSNCADGIYEWQQWFNISHAERYPACHGVQRRMLAFLLGTDTRRER
jgi:hypothetical protein